MSDSYTEYFKKEQKRWESLCIRCGGCCGAFDDPCRHLKKDNKDRYYCEVYDNRFGPQETVGGEKFNCVPIIKLLDRYWKNEHLCAYKKRLRLPWIKF
jgi:uncharacterized cysteine cluster protein YcgN (CxxCxxCC family)